MFFPNQTLREAKRSETKQSAFNFSFLKATKRKKGDHSLSVDSNVIRLNNVRNRLEPFLEVGDLLERISELDNRRRLEDPLRVHDEGSVLEGVEVGGDEEEIGAGLDGQEPRSRNVDSFGVSEVLDGGSDGGFELDDSLAVVGDLVVDAEERERRGRR